MTYGERIEKKCLHCGNMFPVHPYRKDTAKYCSIKCKNKDIPIKYSGENNQNWRGRTTERVCEICAKRFKVRVDHMERNHGRFCSCTCMGIWQRGEKCGDKNPLWKGGITPTMDKIRRLWQYKDWRVKVYTRDNYTCVGCGMVGGRLNAHHIKRFSLIIDDLRIKFPLLPIVGIVENHPEMWDIKNGKTLCKECHKKEHNNGYYKQTQSARKHSKSRNK